MKQEKLHKNDVLEALGNILKLIDISFQTMYPKDCNLNIITAVLKKHRYITVLQYVI